MATDLEVRVCTLEKHVARLLDELDRAQAVAAIRRGYDAAMAGRQKHDIPRA